MVNKISRGKSLIYGKKVFYIRKGTKRNQPAEKMIYKYINRDFCDSKLKEPGQKRQKKLSANLCYSVTEGRGGESCKDT